MTPILVTLELAVAQEIFHYFVNAVHNLPPIKLLPICNKFEMAINESISQSQKNSEI